MRDDAPTVGPFRLAVLIDGWCKYEPATVLLLIFEDLRWLDS